MAYTYNHQEHKHSGIRIPAMLSQKNNLKYKLVSAQDIAWNVKLNNAEQTPIDSTDDLLDYISGMVNNPGEDGSPSEPVYRATYRIQCDLTACYGGLTFTNPDQYPVRVYKTVNGVDTQLSFSEVIEIFDVELTCSVPNTECIIKYDALHTCIYGTANPGVHTMRLKRKSQDAVVALFSIVVLNKQLRTASVVIYITSSTLPDDPVGGRYNFETKKLSEVPYGWSDDLDLIKSSSSDSPIWMSTGTVYDENNLTIVWSAPVMYITSLQILTYDKYASNGVGIYKATTHDIVPTVPAGITYTFSTKTLNNLTDHWTTSPQTAIQELDPSDQNICTVYVSYNSYTAKRVGDSFDDSSVEEVGWTTPIKYIDISGILDEAKKYSDEEIGKAKLAAKNDLLNALADLNVDQVNAVVESLKMLYSWEVVSSAPEGTANTVLTQQQLNSLLTGKLYYNQYYYSTTDRKYYHYTATTATLTTQLSALDSKVSEIKTTVDEKTPDYIRLQASKGYLQNVTWTMVDSVPANSTVNNVPLLPKDGYTYGLYYKLTLSGKTTYYRCDYPISTGFLNILADKLSLGVANDTDAATFILKVGDKNSLAAITASQIVLNGDTIAKAIATKSLNIDSKTYLRNAEEAAKYDNVMAAFGYGTDGTTVFRTDGSGYLAGNRISWGDNGLRVRGHIEATSGYIGGEEHGWSINTVMKIPAIYAIDQTSQQELYITPQYLLSKKAGADKYNWYISRDGSATFANENVKFNKDGSGRIGTDTAGLTISPNGTVELKGVDVTLQSTQLTQIGTQLAENEDFKGLVMSNVGTNVIGQLNTQDVSVGNGSCFFDGTGSNAGSGYVANQNVKWDKDGNVTIKGNVIYNKSQASEGSATLHTISIKAWDENGENYTRKLPNVYWLSGGSYYYLNTDISHQDGKQLRYLNEAMLPQGSQLEEITIVSAPYSDTNRPFTIKGNFRVWGDSAPMTCSQIMMYQDSCMKLIYVDGFWRPISITGDNVIACFGQLKSALGTNSKLWQVNTNGKLHLPISDVSGTYSEGYQINVIQNGSTINDGPTSWDYSTVLLN